MSIPTAPFGKNGPQVNRLGFGLMGLSAFYGTAPKPDEERFALLDAAYEKGERFWDTADMYGDSEDLLGKYFKANPEKRQNIFLATKFANHQTPEGWKSDTSPEYAKQACAKSLARLGLPSVDLYYIHRLDQVTPVEKTMQALVELKNEGKFKYIGISEASAATVRRAHAVHPITAVQVEYSPFSLEIESKQIDLLRTCRELGIATVAYSPLGRGLISGQWTSPDDFEDGDIRKWLPRFSKENFPKNLKLVDQMNEVAKRKGVTTSQLALAWLLAQGDDIFPIPGTQRVSRLEENLGSVSIELTKEEEQELRKAIEAADVGGSRYPDMLMSTCYADTPEL